MQEVDSERNEFKRTIDDELTNLRVTYAAKVNEAETRENRCSISVALECIVFDF